MTEIKIRSNDIFMMNRAIDFSNIAFLKKGMIWKPDNRAAINILPNIDDHASRGGLGPMQLFKQAIPKKNIYLYDYFNYQQ